MTKKNGLKIQQVPTCETTVEHGHAIHENKGLRPGPLFHMMDYYPVNLAWCRSEAGFGHISLGGKNLKKKNTKLVGKRKIKYPQYTRM